ncbi:hypothetical protein JCM10213_004540 [Rhodosporidiobolus nylandii]
MVKKEIGEDATAFAVFRAATEAVKESRPDELILGGFPAVVSFFLRYLQQERRSLPSAFLLSTLRLPTSALPLELHYVGKPPQPRNWKRLARTNDGIITGPFEQRSFDRPAKDAPTETRFFLHVSPFPVVQPDHVRREDFEQRTVGLLVQREQWTYLKSVHNLRPADGTEELVAAAKRALDLINNCRVLNLSAVVLLALYHVSALRLSGLPPPARPIETSLYLLRVVASLQWEAQESHVPTFWVEQDDWVYSARELFGQEGYRGLVQELQQKLNGESAQGAVHWEASLYRRTATDELRRVYEDMCDFYKSLLRITYLKMSKAFIDERHPSLPSMSSSGFLMPHIPNKLTLNTAGLDGVPLPNNENVELPSTEESDVNPGTPVKFRTDGIWSPHATTSSHPHPSPGPIDPFDPKERGSRRPSIFTRSPTNSRSPSLTRRGSEMLRGVSSSLLSPLSRSSTQPPQ